MTINQKDLYVYLFEWGKNYAPFDKGIEEKFSEADSPV